MVTPNTPDLHELAAIAERRKTAWAAGYRPLALLSWTHPNPLLAGKKPIGDDWPKRARQDPPEATRLPAVAHAANTGFMADGLRAIDKDIEDYGIIEALIDLERDTLGDTIIRFRNNSARCMSVYRAASGAPTKLWITGSAGKIEILGYGQQFVAHGWHQTGALLRWRPVPPEQMPVENLPAVTEEQIEAYLRAAADLIGADPEDIKGLKNKRNGKGNGNGAIKADAEPGHIPDELLGVDVAAALDAIAAGTGSHDATIRLVGHWAAGGFPANDVVAIITNALLRRPDSERDAGWAQALKDVPRTVAWAYEQEAESAVPLGPVTAPGSAGNGSTPPPSGGGTASGAAPQPQPQPAPVPVTLLRRRDSRYTGCVENVLTLLRQTPDLVGAFGYDLMARAAVVRRQLPWQSGSLVYPSPVTDNDCVQLQGWLQRNAKLAPLGTVTVHQAIDCIAAENSYHPVRDWMHGLKWDGQRRVDLWLPNYAGSANTDYTQMVGRKFLIGMVARVERPGCKFDYVLVLEGKQGILKSQLLRELGGEWFSDQLPSIYTGGKETSQHLRGKWLIELAELEAMNRSDILAVNAFITRPTELYRPPWGRKEIIEPRQCAFAGTTNSDAYLRDATGGRRFWGVPAGVEQAIDPKALRHDRDQLFAEALAIFRTPGETWWPTAEFEAQHIQPEQEERLIGDAWQDPIETWLEQQQALAISTVSVSDIAQAALGLDHLIRLSPADQQRIFAILRRLKWTRQRSNRGRWWSPPGGNP